MTGETSQLAEFCQNVPCALFAQCEFLPGRLATLGYTKPTCSSHRLSQGLLIRTFFILGNLTASNSDNRRLLVLRLSALPMLGSVLTRVKTFILCCIPLNTSVIATLDSRLQRSCCIRKKQNRVSRKWGLAVSKAHTHTHTHTHKRAHTHTHTLSTDSNFAPEV